MSHKKDSYNSQYTVYALKTDTEKEDDYWKPKLYQSIRIGKARYGWSYDRCGDLRLIRKKLATRRWEGLTSAEKEIWSVSFLLDIRIGDYLVYPNLPSYGKCTIAKVVGQEDKGPYFWDYWDQDFNHCISVEYVGEFDRNDKRVHPELSRRLKLRGRWWTIYNTEDFQELLTDLREGLLKGESQTSEDRVSFLERNLAEPFTSIAEQIHRTHPEKKLEELVFRILKNMPNVVGVERKQGRADKGADIVCECTTLPNIQTTKCIVQVKSFVGTMGDFRAIEDIERAFQEYPEATTGLIVTTALDITEEFEKRLDQTAPNVKKSMGKDVQVDVMIGAELAKWCVQFALFKEHS